MHHILPTLTSRKTQSSKPGLRVNLFSSYPLPFPALMSSAPLSGPHVVRSPFRPSCRLQHLCCIASHLPMESGMPQRPKQCVTTGTHGPFSKRRIDGIADKMGRHVSCDRLNRALGVFRVSRVCAIVLDAEFHASRALAYPKGFSYVRRCKKVCRRSSGLP